MIIAGHTAQQGNRKTRVYIRRRQIIRAITGRQDHRPADSQRRRRRQAGNFPHHADEGREGTADSPTGPEPDEITPQELRKINIWEYHERGEVTKMMKMTGTNEPYTTSRASEAFASITTKIAMHAAIEAHKEGIRYEHIATTARILRLWETHRINRQAYAGGSHEYNDSKIRLTVGKAKAAGWQLYTELMTHPQPLNQRRARQ